MGFLERGLKEIILFIFIVDNCDSVVGKKNFFMFIL